MTPQEARIALADALESGRFTQTTGMLERCDRNGNVVGNCCLGVACRLYIEDGGKLHVKRYDDAVTFDSEFSILPSKVRKWLGFADDNGKTRDSLNVSLSNLNDNGVPFVELAKIIRDDQVALVESLP